MQNCKTEKFFTSMYLSIFGKFRVCHLVDLIDIPESTLRTIKGNLKTRTLTNILKFKFLANVDSEEFYKNLIELKKSKSPYNTSKVCDYKLNVVRTIRDYRIVKGVTTTEASNFLGIEYNTLNKAETGNAHLSNLQLLRLVEAIDKVDRNPKSDKEIIKSYREAIFKAIHTKY